MPDGFQRRDFDGPIGRSNAGKQSHHRRKNQRHQQQPSGDIGNVSDTAHAAHTEQRADVKAGSIEIHLHADAHQPPGDGLHPNRKIIQNKADQNTKQTSYNTADKTDGAGFNEEHLAYLRKLATEHLHHADLFCSFVNRHRHGIGNVERRHQK